MDKLPKLLSFEESVRGGVVVCKEQIDARMYMVKNVLGGWLYTSVTLDEIERLKDAVERFAKGETAKDILPSELDLDAILESL